MNNLRLHTHYDYEVVIREAYKWFSTEKCILELEINRHRTMKAA
jgi:hypothetical protein